MMTSNSSDSSQSATSTQASVETSSQAASQSASSAPAATSTPAATPQQSSGGAAVDALNSQTPTQEAKPFSPNFKFKVKDVEHEVDEIYKSFITDEKKEKALKDLYTKAYGLDSVKENLNKQKSEYDNYKKGVEPTLKNYNFLNTILGNKDWDTFFGKLGVPEQEIFDWVSKRLDLHRATPEQQREYQQQTALREQHYMQSQQLQEMQSQYQNQAVQHRTMQLDSLLNRQDVSQYASAWDQRQGSVGSFRQLIIDEAAAAFYQTGRDISTEEAVNNVIQKFGKVVPMQQAAIPQQQQAFGAPQAPGNVPVIPSVTGKGTSPVKKVPKSLDDLRELARNA